MLSAYHLSAQPKQLFVNFYAAWCLYCRKVKQETYRDSAGIANLNTK